MSREINPGNASELFDNDNGDGFSEAAERLRQYEGLPEYGYNNTSSINPRARGFGNTELNTQAAIEGENLSCNSERRSEYSQVQVTQTPGGHIIELNDVIGSERVMIRHSSGSGIEFRPDGSVIISATSLILDVQGNTNLVSSGNLNLSAEGSVEFNAGGDGTFNFSGNSAFRSGGNMVQTAGGSLHQRVTGDMRSRVAGLSSNIIVGERTDVVLGGASTNISGDMNTRVDGEVGLFSSGGVAITGQRRAFISSPSVSVTGEQLELVGSNGTIGGENMIMYSYNSFVGHSLHAGETVNTNTVYADVSVETDTIRADYTNSHTIENEVFSGIDIAFTNEAAGPVFSASNGFIGDLRGIAEFADGSSTFVDFSDASATGTAEEAVDAIDNNTDDTFLPTHNIVSSRHGTLGNGIRDVSIDPGEYIIRSIYRNIDFGFVESGPVSGAGGTGGSTSSLPGGFSTGIGGTGSSGSPLAAPSIPRPTSPAPSTNPTIGRNAEIAGLNEDQTGELQQISDETNINWVPISSGGGILYVTSDYLLNTDGTYFRASKNTAQQQAQNLGGRLPTTTEVDAIYAALEAFYPFYAAGVPGVDGTTEELIEIHDNSPSVIRIPRGSDRLLDGHLKTVSTSGGTVGIYGGRYTDRSIVQPFFSGHGDSYVDYSQGCRIVRESQV